MSVSDPNSFDIDLIESSFAALSGKIDDLATIFYDELFSSYPVVKPLFGRVDLVIQRKKLTAMLALIVNNLRQPDILLSAMHSLGANHIGYGAKEEHYWGVEKCLLKSLEQLAGDMWNDQLHDA